MTSGKTIGLATRPTEKARLTLAVLPPATPLLSVFQMACQLAAAVMQVERVGIWLLDNHDQELICKNLYELSKESHSRGQVLKVASFPQYFESLRHRKAVPAEQAAIMNATDELRDEYLTPNRITSMLDAGIFLDGRLHGALCLEQVGNSREWTTEDRDFAGSVADLIAVRMLQSRLAIAAARLTLFDRDRSRAAQQSAIIESGSLRMEAAAAKLSRTLPANLAGLTESAAPSALSICSEIQSTAQQVTAAARDLQETLSGTHDSVLPADDSGIQHGGGSVRG